MATTYFTDTTPETAAAPSATRTQLRWQNAAGDTRTLVLANGPTTIGGGPRCAVRVDAAGARPLHCVVQCENGDTTIRRWSNGAMLNGRPFTEAPLRPGDTLTIAGVEFQAEEAPADSDSEAATNGAPVPAHLMQPWLDANPQPAAGDDSAESERLRAALQTTRGRVRSALAALREQRTAGELAKGKLELAITNRDDLATKLLLVTTELHDCRTELEQVRAEFNTASIDQEDHRRLYEIAKEEVDELEQQVASLRSEQETLLAERTEWATQREQLESAIVALESRVAQPQEPSLDEPELDAPQADEHAAEECEAESFEQHTVEVDAAHVETATDEPSWEVALPEASADDVTGKADPVEAFKAVVEEETVEETPAADQAVEETISEETPREETPAAFSWGVETPVASEQEAPETPVEETSCDPWLSAWGVESNEPANEEANADTAPEAPSDEQQEQSANDWLASFASAPGTPPTPVEVEPETIEDRVEDAAVEAAEQTFEDHAEEVEPLPTPAADEFASPGDDDQPLFASPIQAPVDLEPETGSDTHEEVAEAAPEAVSGVEPEGYSFAKSDGAEPAVSESLFGDPADPAPESVEDLIAEEQPTSEAPVSFIDQFADQLPADEPDEPAFGGSAVEHSGGLFAEPVAQPAIEPLPLEEGEESIEDYMAKLMQRMRGEEGEPSAPAKPMAALATAAAKPETPTEEPQPEAAPAPVVPLTNLDELRSGPAPEQTTDMSSLRALANQTARNAIGVSEVQQTKEQAAIKLIMAVVAIALGALLGATAKGVTDWTMYVGLAIIGAGGWWFCRTLKTSQGAIFVPQTDAD